MDEVELYHFLKGWIPAISDEKRFKKGKMYITVEDEFGDKTRYSIDWLCDTLDQSKKIKNYRSYFPNNFAKDVDIDVLLRFVNPVIRNNRRFLSISQLENYTDLSPKKIGKILAKEFIKGNLRPYDPKWLKSSLSVVQTVRVATK